MSIKEIKKVLIVMIGVVYFILCCECVGQCELCIIVEMMVIGRVIMMWIMVFMMFVVEVMIIIMIIFMMFVVEIMIVFMMFVIEVMIIVVMFVVCVWNCII